MSGEEIVASIIVGVVTGLILELFRRRDRSSGSQSQSQSRAEARRERRGDGILAQFVRLVLAVAGGVAIAVLGGRYLIQSGALPPGQPTRIGLLIVGTMVVWLLLLLARGRR